MAQSGPEPGPVGAPPGYGLDKAESQPGERLPWAEVAGWFERSRNYWIVTASPEGRPHAMPVWGVWLDGTVWFGTNPDSRKARNLKADARLVVHLESGDDVGILEGEVELRTEPDVARRFTEAFNEKYDAGLDLKGTFVLRPQVGFSWRESDFVETATRWRFT